VTTLRIDGDGGGAVKAISDLNAAISKTDAALGKTAKSAKTLETAAGRIVKANETAQEKYNRRIAELAELVNRGKLNWDQAAQAARRYEQQLEKAGNTGRRAFGDEAIAKLGQFAAGYFSLGAAVGAVQQALADVEQQAQRSADAVFASLASAGELQQLSESPEQFQALMGESRSLVKRGIVRPDQSREAFETVFNLQSAGFNPQEREAMFAAADKKQVKDIVGLGGKLRGAQDVFGVEDTGDISEMLDKVLTVSKATLENATKTAEQIPNFGSEARALGVDFETAAAAYVAIRKQSAGAEIASTRERALFAAIDKGGLYEGDLPSTIAAITKRIEGGKSAFDVLGNIRAVAGYRALATPEGQNIFAAQLPLITNAKGATASQDYLNTDPILRAAALKEKAEGAAAFNQEQLSAERELLLDAYREEIRNQRGTGFFGTLARAGDWVDFGFSDVTQNEAGAFQAELDRAQLWGNRLSPELTGAMQDYLKRAAEASERTAAGIDELKGKKTSSEATRTPTRAE
jgi:hypothetical protein